jgi:hypothetical protein
MLDSIIMAPIKISFLALAAVAACAGTSTAIVPAITIASTIIQPSAQSNTSSALLAITATSSTIQKSTSVSGSKGAAAATNGKFTMRI